MNQELQAAIMPDASIRLEWEDTEAHINKSQELLQREIARRFYEHPDGGFLFLGFCDRATPLSASLNFWRSYCGLFAHQLSLTPDLESLRQQAQVAISAEEIEHALGGAPLMVGAEYLSAGLLENIWQRLLAEFRRKIADYPGTVEAFIHAYSPAVHLVGRVYFHLVENKLGDTPFAFMATYSTGLNVQGKSRHLPLKHALEEYGGTDHGSELLELLATVHRAAKLSALIAALVDSGELFHPLAWSAKEAHTFLQEIPLYEQSGILCRIPDWWKAASSSLQVRVAMGEAAPATVGMDALLNFDIGLYLQGSPISAEEARRLLASAEGLVMIKNRWVAVDAEKLQQALAAYDAARKLSAREGLTFRDALRFQMNPRSLMEQAGDDDVVSVTSGAWLESVLTKMRHPDTATIAPPKLGASFKAKLRPYQQQGITWLAFLHSLKFGMCLADDMGLGKTVQVLALLHSLKQQGEKGASLLVMPASLLANWANEIKKFAPDLTFYIAHPSARDSGNRSGSTNAHTAKTAGDLDALDLVITTYSLVQKYEWLHAYTWKLVILDEAQAIKNPGAQQTKAVKKLAAANRMVMTGTPVENRLSDLWSLFDFINPGLLGSAAEFGRFAKSLKDDTTGYARLRQIISPYILRRLKTDKKVIADLPDKVEMKTWSNLSKKQAVLYQKMVDDLRRMVESADGIQRKGAILGALMKFKQLCNHPDQYLGSGNFDENDSGKFGRLREICETIHEKRERVLVFTQFREMTEPLGQFLQSIFGRQGLVLHGGTAVAKRAEIVAQFQQGDYTPFMVLSLKAGGVGLNLTAANHVIHFDRWWNPAVENQATDRAFRIGQQKNVIVHKFITQGTVEEKIDKMIENKAKLSNEVIATGSEAWITELGNEELMKLFALTL